MKSRWLKTCGVLLACATLSSFVACGDDDDGDAGVMAGTGGASGTGTGGMTGGSGGAKAGSGGSAGGGMTVTCGTATCTVNTTLKQLAPTTMACCTATTMKCGQTNTQGKCLEKMAPGTPDSTCPTIQVAIPGMGMFPQAGCCTPAKKCGGNFNAVDWGCVAREDTDMGMGGPLPALACGTAADGGGDAGL
jgi:hypothetical protein